MRFRFATAFVVAGFLAACGGSGSRQPPNNVQFCATAADCTGVLPAFCLVCADGGAECEHWSCVSASCVAADLCGLAQH